MPDLYVTRACPNPAGKDRRPPAGPTTAQLNGEWLEFRNESSKMLSLANLELFHVTFDQQCSRTGEARVTGFTGNLAAGYSLRVHTGAGEGFWENMVFHLFLDRQNFIWNNACGDLAALRLDDGSLIDWAAYTPRPADGQVLNRIRGTNTLA